jgi:two-component system response regulator RegA
MKQSGMPWSKKSGQSIVDSRTACRGRLWERIWRRWQDSQTNLPPINQSIPEFTRAVAGKNSIPSRLHPAFRLVRRGLNVIAAADGSTAAEKAEHCQPELAVVDLKMPGQSGLELLKKLSAVSPKTRVVILTGYGSIANAIEAVKLGAVNYVTKPADADQVLAAFDEDHPNDTSEPQFLPPSLAEAQWEHIQRVLADCNGNISEAARQLDIPRRTLQRKLKKNAP